MTVVHIDRIVIRGDVATRLDRTVLAALVAREIETRFAGARLPAGRTMRASVALETASLGAGGERGLAATVATAVVQATGAAHA